MVGVCPLSPQAAARPAAPGSSAAQQGAACPTCTAATGTTTAGTSATSGTASAPPAVSSAPTASACPWPLSAMGRRTARLARTRRSAQVRERGRAARGDEPAVAASPLGTVPFPAGRVTCAPGQLPCPNGSCMGQAKLCDGVWDCRDGWDESPARCIVSWATPVPAQLPTAPANGTAGEGHACPLHRAMSPVSWGLTRSTPLVAGTERPGLPPAAPGVTRGDAARGPCSLWHPGVTPPAPACGPYEFPCQSGECTPRGWLCDSEADCLDGSDELGCNRSCGLGQFPCALGAHCIPHGHLCDGVPHCPDHSDESADTCGEVPRVPKGPRPLGHPLGGGSEDLHPPGVPRVAQGIHPSAVTPDGVVSLAQALPRSRRARATLCATTACA